VNPNFTAVKHSKTQNVAVLDGASTDNLGKMAKPNAQKLSRFTTLKGLIALSLFLS